MTVPLVVLWLHVLAAVVWIGGLLAQAHVVMPLARRGDVRLFATLAGRARPLTWTAIGLVALTGFYNVTRLGPLDHVMASGAGLLLAAKFFLVLLMVAVAGQRDFTALPRLGRALAAGDGADEPASALRAIAWLDRAVLALALVVLYLGLAVSRAR
jgi:uncharacterized membrane protein